MIIYEIIVMTNIDNVEYNLLILGAIHMFIYGFELEDVNEKSPFQYRTSEATSVLRITQLGLC